MSDTMVGLIAFICAGWLWWAVLWGVYTGTAVTFLKTTEVKAARNRNPIGFWAIMLLNSALGAAIIWCGLHLVHAF